MKNFQTLIYFVLLLSIGLLTPACLDDEEFFIGENCDDTGCNEKSCATTLDKNTRSVECFLSANSDVDWYQFIVTEEDVSIGTLSYDFTFSNDTESLFITVSLFDEGVSEGGVLTTGDIDGLFEPMESNTGAVTFLEAGTYFIKVSRNSGDRGDGEYRFSFFWGGGGFWVK